MESFPNYFFPLSFYVHCSIYSNTIPSRTIKTFPIQSLFLKSLFFQSFLLISFVFKSFQNQFLPNDFFTIKCFCILLQIYLISNFLLKIVNQSFFFFHSQPLLNVSILITSQKCNWHERAAFQRSSFGW